MPFVKTCQGCGRTFMATRSIRLFCTRKCWARWREQQPEWIGARNLGRLKGIETHRRKSLAFAAPRVIRCDTKAAAYVLGKRTGYLNGWKRGQRVGYSAGYEAALRDMKRGAVA